MYKVQLGELTVSVNLFTFLPLKATFVFTSFIILLLVQSFFCIPLSFSIFIDELLVINTGMSAARGRENDRLKHFPYGDISSVEFHEVVSSSNYYDTAGLSDTLNTQRYTVHVFPPSKRWEPSQLYITQTTQIQDSGLLCQSQWKLCWKTKTKLIRGHVITQSYVPWGPTNTTKYI